MKRHVIATVAAAAIALGGLGATPVAARSDKDEKTLALILGIGAAALIYNDIQKKKDRKRRAQNVSEQRPVIPGECVYELRLNGGSRDVVSQRCLGDFGLSRLPEQCAFDVQGYGGTRRVYGARCLQDEGYRIEGARY